MNITALPTRRFLPLIVALALSTLFGEAGQIIVPEHHKTIQAAIDAAGPGDEVVVKAGIYRERIQLRKGLTVRSAGDATKGKLGLKRAEETVIDGGGDPPEGQEAVPGVAMAEGSALDGFTVTNVGRYDDAKWNEHHATRGANQPHEHIGGFGAPGIGVDGAVCEVLNNIVHHNGHTGIAVRGLEEKKVIPVIKSNSCYRNMGGGIGLMHNAGGLVTDNTCFENFYAGIGHNGAGAHARVLRNRCYANIRAGIGISEGSCPTVSGNECYQNRRAGIGIRTGDETKPIVEDNHCYENGMAGIGTDEGAAPTIRKNRCLRNALAGIGARGNSKPVIEDNEVRENKAAGIGLAACDEGRAVIRGNTIVNNAMVAIGVQGGWTVDITKNILSREGGLPPLIMVFKDAKATIRENTLSGNGVAGVRLAGSAELIENTFNGGKIRKAGPPHFGVWALPGSTLTMRHNIFTNWRHALQASGAAVTATENRAEGFSGVAFVVQQPSAPAKVSANVAVSSDPKATPVRVDGDQAGVEKNIVRAPE